MVSSLFLEICRKAFFGFFWGSQNYGTSWGAMLVDMLDTRTTNIARHVGTCLFIYINLSSAQQVKCW